jgi:cadmium resistance protein CadD (predicted permease)
MDPLLLIIALTAVTFVTTNLDNLGMLIILIAEESYSAREVIWGYLLSALIVFAAAWLVAEAVELAPDQHLGYLGFIPIALGVYRAWELTRGPPGNIRIRASSSGLAAVTLLMLAQSGDTLAVYVSLFADTSESLELVMLITFSVCAALWIALARWLASHRLIAEPLERWGRYLLPVLLIVIGVLILLDTPTDIA